MGVQKAYNEIGMYHYLLEENRVKKRSLRDLAKEFGVSYGVIQRALDGRFPKRFDLRVRMGLPEISEVLTVNGNVPYRSQTLGAQRCACGQHFISNHPRRKRCFICSPFRGKKK
jgi:hypothetical protein